MATSTLPETSAILESPGFSLLDIRYRITVDEYHRIIESGALGPEPRVELLEGVIVQKMAKNPPHNLACDLIQYLLMRLLPTGYFISMGTSMTIEERQGEPEPDAMILRGQMRDYAGRRRTSADAAIAIEVSDTTYNTDRTLKWSLYAASGVPVYWILDLNRKHLEIHSEPTAQVEKAGYARSKVLGPDDEVPLVLDGREFGRFRLREIMP